jgi:hypothetical protein
MNAQLQPMQPLKTLPQSLDATPPRHPLTMPRQMVDYWTPRAVAVSLLRAMAAGLGPQRTLRRAAIPVTSDDE